MYPNPPSPMSKKDFKSTIAYNSNRGNTGYTTYQQSVKNAENKQYAGNVGNTGNSGSSNISKVTSPYNLSSKCLGPLSPLSPNIKNNPLSPSSTKIKMLSQNLLNPKNPGNSVNGTYNKAGNFHQQNDSLLNNQQGSYATSKRISAADIQLDLGCDEVLQNDDHDQQQKSQLQQPDSKRNMIKNNKNASQEKYSLQKQHYHHSIALSPSTATGAKHKANLNPFPKNNSKRVLALDEMDLLCDETLEEQSTAENQNHPTRMPLTPKSNLYENKPSLLKRKEPFGNNNIYGVGGGGSQVSANNSSNSNKNLININLQKQRSCSSNDLVAENNSNLNNLISHHKFKRQTAEYQTRLQGNSHNGSQVQQTMKGKVLVKQLQQQLNRTQYILQEYQRQLTDYKSNEKIIAKIEQDHRKTIDFLQKQNAQLRKCLNIS